MRRNLRWLVCVILVGCLVAGIAWLSDERNRIAIDHNGRRALGEHEAVLGVRAGMPLEEAVAVLERRGLAQDVGGYHPTECDGVGTMGHELSILNYEYHSFDDYDRWPIGGACLLVQQGRVVRMEAYYVLFTPL